MNYLQLCQRMIQEGGITGTLTTVLNQVGELQRVVGWVDAAWQDIQTAHRDWGWMRTSASFTTVAGQATYLLGTTAGTVGVAATSLGMWAKDTARNYVTAVGTNSEIFMDCIPYEAWRNDYMYGALRNTRTRPMQFAIGPDYSINLGPVPIDGYTVTIDYFTAPTHLSADADTPGMPEWFHMAVVQRALMYYGAYESAPEVYDSAQKEFGIWMRRLDNSRLPDTQFAGALA